MLNAGINLSRHSSSFKLWVPQLCAFDCAVQTAPVLQVCRRRSIGARREHRLNPFDEPMKVRASHSGHLLTGLFWVEACWAGWPPRQLPCRGSSRAVVLASGAGSPRHHLMGGGRGGPRGRFRRCAAAAGPRTRAISAPSRGRPRSKIPGQVAISPRTRPRRPAMQKRACALLKST